jgi:hypothetical protein
MGACLEVTYVIVRKQRIVPNGLCAVNKMNVFVPLIHMFKGLIDKD